MNTTLIVLITYLLFTFLIAWIFSRKESIEGYFLNKKKTSLWLMMFSSVATIVGAGATVAIVSEVYNSGISYGLALPISLVAGVIILGIVAKKIKQVGDKYNAYTIVDFFYKRFDVKNKMLTTILQLFILIIWIGIQAIAISSLISVLTGLDYYVALILTAIVTIAYTTIGGLKIDIITDFIQFWIIFIMFIIISIFGYFHVGGISNLISNLPKGHLNPFAFGGVGWFVGAIILSGFIYLGNTSHWQRIFSAKNENVARKSFYLTIPFILVLGVLILFMGLVASVSLTGIKQETAIFSLIIKILPPWLAGLGFASILAVIMSSVDSLLIGGSTIIYKTLFKKKEIQGKKGMIYARIITGIFGVLGFLIAFLVPNIITLSLLVTYLTLIFVPPVIAGLYSKKTSSNASFWAILIPTIVLFIFFSSFGKNIFLLTTLLSTLIVIFYDKIFKKSPASQKF